MKRFFATMLILVVLMCAVLGCTVVADASSSSASDIHLVNPSSAVVVDDTLYIADNVTQSNCVVLVFDISNSTPIYSTMIELSGNVVLMRYYIDTLYIVMQDCYLVYDIGNNSYTTVDTAIQDIAILQHNSRLYTYTIVDGIVLRDGASKDWSADNIVICDNVLYIVDGSSSATVTLISGDDINESKSNSTGNVYTSLANYDTTLISYNSTTIDIDGTVANIELADIECVALLNTDLLILSNNKLTQYTFDQELNSYTAGFVVGSDTVSVDTPSLSDITSYTVVTSNGYPTNIVYKTTGDNSIDSLIELDNQTVIILDYTGSENCDYYYVYTEDGFGWIKKGESSLAQESTLTISDTSLNNTTNYSAKLISAYSVTVYDLPDNSYVRHQFTQSATEPTTVQLLQEYTDSASTKWYYISYDIDNITYYGYVTSGDIGYIYSSGTNSTIVLDSDTPYMKINTSMVGQVNMYMTSDMASGQELVDNNGDTIVLDNNTRVGIITVLDSCSYVQVTTDSGTYYGWVYNDNLISTTALPTTTIIGLILLVVALILIVTTIVIVKANKKSIIKQDNIN